MIKCNYISKVSICWILVNCMKLLFKAIIHLIIGWKTLALVIDDFIKYKWNYKNNMAKRGIKTWHSLNNKDYTSNGWKFRNYKLARNVEHLWQDIWTKLHQKLHEKKIYKKVSVDFKLIKFKAIDLAGLFA